MADCCARRILVIVLAMFCHLCMGQTKSQYVTGTESPKFYFYYTVTTQICELTWWIEYLLVLEF